MEVVRLRLVSSEKIIIFLYPAIQFLWCVCANSSISSYACTG